MQARRREVQARGRARPEPVGSRDQPEIFSRAQVARVAATRQPSWNNPRNASATRMNATAVPWPETTRSSMPMATVHSHTPTPVGTTAVGRRQYLMASMPATAPVRNGHAVLASPAMLPPA